MNNQDIEAMIEQSIMFDDDVMMNNYDDGEDFQMTSSNFHDSSEHSGFLSSTSNQISSSDISFPNQSTTNRNSSVKDIFYCPNYFDLNDILSQTIRLSVKFQRTIPKLGFLDPSQQQQQDQEEQKCNYDISKGTKLELPLWIVKELNGDFAVTVTLPKGYNQVYREILEADANCVNLHKLGPNYYLSGKHLTTMNLEESEDIALTMLDTFTQRFHRLVNFALSGSACIGGSSDSSSSAGGGNSVQSSTCSSISELDSVIKSNPYDKLLRESKGAASTSIKDETLNDLNQFASRLDNWERHLLDVGRRLAGQMKRWENRDLVRVRANEMVINLKKRKILLQQQKQLQMNNTQ